MKNAARRKKLLFLITKSNWGGAQRYVYDLATNLSQEQFDMVVVLGGEGPLKQKLEEKRVRTIVIHSFQRDINIVKELNATGELFQILRKEKPDIVHLNSSKAGGLGALVARLCGIPCILFTAHGWPFKEKRSFVMRSMIHIATWLTVVLSHKTIVVSKKDEELGKSMWFVRGKIKHIPIALNETKFLSKEKAEEFLFWPEVDSYIIHSIRLVTIAELTKNKGLQYGIDMIQELQNRNPDKYTYNVFGDGEERTDLTKRSEKVLNSKGQPIVRFLNIFEYKYPNLQKPKFADFSTSASRYLKAFDIFILPSVKEGTPYVLLEAAAAGLPIVATNVVEQEAKDTPHIYFVPPGNGQALADKVEALTKQMPPKTTNVIVGTTVMSFEKMLERTYSLYTLHS